MKQKFEDQIKEIDNLIKEERIEKLTDSLRDELNRFDFEHFTELMSNEIYDTEIFYDKHRIFQEDMPEKQHFHENPIPKPGSVL